MRVRYAVTFEFLNQAPVTHRGTATGTTAATCMARAVKTAQRTLRPVNWSSLVCVLLERVTEAEVEAPEEAPGEAGRPVDPEAVPAGDRG